MILTFTEGERGMTKALACDESADVRAEESTEGVVAIDVLPPKIQRFIHLYVTGQYTLSRLSQLLEVHPNTLGAWLRRGDVKEIISNMQKDTHDVVTVQLKALTMKAVNKLSALTESPIDGVALAAVKDILDRAGHKSKQEIKVDKTVTTFEQKLNNLIEDSIDVEYEIMEDDS